MSEKNKVGVKCKRPYHLPSPSLADKKLRKLNWLWFNLKKVQLCIEQS